MIALRDPTLLRDLCLVGGAWRPARGGVTFPVVNPATGDTVAQVP